MEVEEQNVRTCVTCSYALGTTEMFGNCDELLITYSNDPSANHGITSTNGSFENTNTLGQSLQWLFEYVNWPILSQNHVGHKCSTHQTMKPLVYP